jgi:hypothetical protein
LKDLAGTNDNSFQRDSRLLDHFTLLYVFLRSVVFVSVCLLIMCVCFVMTAKVVLGTNGENPVNHLVIKHYKSDCLN